VYERAPRLCACALHARELQRCAVHTGRKRGAYGAEGVRERARGKERRRREREREKRGRQGDGPCVCTTRRVYQATSVVTAIVPTTSRTRAGIRVLVRLFLSSSPSRPFPIPGVTGISGTPRPPRSWPIPFSPWSPSILRSIRKFAESPLFLAFFSLSRSFSSSFSSSSSSGPDPP